MCAIHHEINKNKMTKEESNRKKEKTEIETKSAKSWASKKGKLLHRRYHLEDSRKAVSLVCPEGAGFIAEEIKESTNEKGEIVITLNLIMKELHGKSERRRLEPLWIGLSDGPNHEIPNTEKRE